MPASGEPPRPGVRRRGRGAAERRDRGSGPRRRRQRRRVVRRHELAVGPSSISSGTAAARLATIASSRALASSRTLGSCPVAIGGDRLASTNRSAGRYASITWSCGRAPCQTMRSARPSARRAAAAREAARSRRARSASTARRAGQRLEQGLEPLLRHEAGDAQQAHRVGRMGLPWRGPRRPAGRAEPTGRDRGR